MIEFSTLQGVTIPEGAVTQIADANGVVLWSAKRNAVVTITSTCNGINGDTSRITVISTEPFANPSGTTTTWTVEAWEMPNCTIEIPIGSTIECYVRDTKQSNRCSVFVNDVEVLTNPGTYIYTVTGNVAVDVSDMYSMGEYGIITITEEGR